MLHNHIARSIMLHRMSLCNICQNRPIKYAKLNLCAACYTKQKRHETIKVDNVAQDVAPREQVFIPNWQRNGFKSKEEAVLKAIAQVVKNVPNAVVSYGGLMWNRENFSKNFLQKISPVTK